MTEQMREATDKVWRTFTQDTVDGNELGHLISLALKESDSLEGLQAENEALAAEVARLRAAIATAGAEIERLTANLDRYEHLTQYTPDEVVE